jgi:spermidine synthase
MSENRTDTKHLIYTDVFFLGFTLIGAQIIFIREFLLLFNGNELVIGLLFTIWMISTAAGSFTGRFYKSINDYPALFRALLVFVTVYPIVAIFSAEYFRNDVFELGRMASLTEIIAFSFVLLLPVCFTGGFLFTILNGKLGNESKSLHNSYAIESFGSLVGGAVISLYFIYTLGVNNFRSLTYLLIINFVYFGISDFRHGKEVRSFIFLLLAIGFMYLIYNVEPGQIAKEKYFEGQKLLVTKETPFGNLSITKTGDQLNYYENGVILFSDDNITQREEDVHYAMLQRQSARKVLLIGGGITGTLTEILKYPSVEQLYYVDINPELINLTEKFFKSFQTKRIYSYAIDPVMFVKQTLEKFDVVLVNMPSPVNAQLNRFFTIEFYHRLKHILNHNGLISTRLPSSSNYLSENEIKLQATVLNSLGKVFKNVLLVPGDKNYFIASDSAVQINYANLLTGNGFENSYVNKNYINDDLIRFRSGSILNTFKGVQTVNYDFKPVVYLSAIKHWMSYYGDNSIYITFLCLAFALVFIIFSKPFSSVMFTSGFTGAGTEIILLIAFQVLAGYVYLYLGVVITLFMAGLSIGAFESRKINPAKRNKFTILVQLISGALILITAMTLYFLKEVEVDYYVQFVIGLLILLISILVGFQYGLSVSKNNTEAGKIVSVIYSSDLFGSAFGSLVVAIFFIPVFGIYFSLYIMAGLHLLTLLIYLIKRKIKYL